MADPSQTPPPFHSIPGIIVTDEPALKRWLATEPHTQQCAAAHELLWCCLDKLTVREGQTVLLTHLC